MRQVRPRPEPEPVVRFETPPGLQAQVDFADFKFPWGKRHALMVVLGYSRLLWLTSRGTDVTVGLPGTGIGGLFYLLSALCMPVAALVRRGGGRRARWRAVREQWLIGVGVIAGLWVTGWLLALMLAPTPVGDLAARAAVDASGVPNVLQAGSVLVALGTLGGVIVAVWLAALVVHGPAAGRRLGRRLAAGLPICRRPRALVPSGQ